MLPLAGYDPEVGSALWRVQDSRARTLRVLEGVPSDFAKRQTAGNSVGTILYHLALIEADWLYVDIMGEDVPDSLRALLPFDDRDQEGVLTLVQSESLEDHLERLASIRQIFLEKLRGMSAVEFHQIRTLPEPFDYEVSPAWVLHHLSQHEAEHRSELSAVIAALRQGARG